MKLYLNDELRDIGQTTFKLTDIEENTFRVYRVEGQGLYEARTYKAKENDKNLPHYRGYDLEADSSTITSLLYSIVTQMYEQDRNYIIITLPLELDTDTNDGIFLYIYLSTDINFNTDTLKPVVLAQSLESWMWNFTGKREQTLKELEKQFSRKIHPKGSSVQHITEGELSSKELNNLVKAYEQSLLFGDEKHVEEIEKALFGSAFQMNIVTANHSILGASTTIRNRLPDLNISSDRCNTWDLTLDIGGFTLEGCLGETEKLVILKNLVNSIKYTAKRFGITEYEAWRQTVTYIRGDMLYYYWHLTVQELEYLIQISNYEVLDFINIIPIMFDSAEYTLSLDYQDFITNTETVKHILTALHATDKYEYWSLPVKWYCRDTAKENCKHNNISSNMQGFEIELRLDDLAWGQSKFREGQCVIILDITVENGKDMMIDIITSIVTYPNGYINLMGQKVKNPVVIKHDAFNDPDKLDNAIKGLTKVLECKKQEIIAYKQEHMLGD